MTYIFSTKISIIIPVYNAERYLNTCIKSIINQTLKDIEIIIVNDGSTDNSLSICLDYAKVDKRIVVIDKPNGGVSSARNAGIKVAKGEYIGFVDADDWIEPKMYESMYHQIKQDQSDICMCNYLEESNGIVREVPLNIPTNKDTLFKPDIVNYLILNMIGPEDANSNAQTIMGNVWRLLIKKELLVNTQIEFPIEIPIMEDLIFCVNALLKCERVSINKGFYYHYIFHSGSAVRSYCEDLDKVQLEVFSLLENILLKKNIYEKYKSRLNMRYINMYISNIVNEINRDNKKSIGEKFQKVKQFCTDSKLQDIIKTINMRSYTLRKKTILTSIKYGFSLYVFLYYYLFGKLIAIRQGSGSGKDSGL